LDVARVDEPVRERGRIAPERGGCTIEEFDELSKDVL